MASASNKTETVTVDIAPAMDPIDTITEESVVSSSLNEEEASFGDNEDSDSESNGDAQDSDVSDGEDEEDSQSDGDSIVDDRDSTDDKPEWGVDSYDESKYCSLMKTLDSWSDEEDERKARLSTSATFAYSYSFLISKEISGFLVEKGIRPRQQWTGYVHLQSLDSERSPVTGRTQLQYTQDMAKLCLRKYNALNETDVKMDHVVRVTESFSGSWVSYITFMARESEEEATLVEYQAKAVKNLGRKSYPIFCRPSPKQDHDM
ncbi:hypothetical protein Bca52824_002543 [Brassica carinata]|uniref:Uncharacterized protein n=1 Tax=Brassica carinata TaxID=52824 RepID=A0A8X7WNJ3_BRACI|nr:hypothetical protein Bca52824_002543 [Brassica carinata]